MSPTQRKAIEDAIKTLDYAAHVSSRAGLMDRCGKSAESLRAALAEADEPVAWRTEAARWLRRRADVEEWASEKTGWANPARQMPATLRRIAEQLEAEQEEAPYGMDCLLEPRREPLTEEQIRDLWSWASTHEAEKTATTQQHAFARAIERAHGIGGGE